MTKVYCSRCKYYQDYGMDEHCDAPDNLTLGDNYLRSNGRKARELFPQVKNRDNCCLSYKPRWWVRLFYRK